MNFIKHSCFMIFLFSIICHSTEGDHHSPFSVPLSALSHKSQKLISESVKTEMQKGNLTAFVEMAVKHLEKTSCEGAVHYIQCTQQAPNRQKMNQCAVGELSPFRRYLFIADYIKELREFPFLTPSQKADLMNEVFEGIEELIPDLKQDPKVLLGKLVETQKKYEQCDNNLPCEKSIMIKYIIRYSPTTCSF